MEKIVYNAVKQYIIRIIHHKFVSDMHNPANRDIHKKLAAAGEGLAKAYFQEKRVFFIVIMRKLSELGFFGVSGDLAVKGNKELRRKIIVKKISLYHWISDVIYIFDWISEINPLKFY